MHIHKVVVLSHVLTSIFNVFDFAVHLLIEKRTTSELLLYFK